ncbi:MAG: hypothetical protein ACR2NM_07055, partial [Bythopirellula sp.]
DETRIEHGNTSIRVSSVFNPWLDDYEKPRTALGIDPATQSLAEGHIYLEPCVMMAFSQQLYFESEFLGRQSPRRLCPRLR